MQQLIQLTANAQGEQAVSAKELYDFLGFNGAHWAKWYKKNIENNPFAIEGADWEVFTLSAKTDGGRPTKDFALSLDFAKRISQMARTAKGEEIRNYFIQCEKSLQNQQITLLDPEDILIQQLQLTKALRLEQEQIKSELSGLKNTVSSLVEGRNEATKQLLAAERSPEPIPEETLRVKIRRLINQYCEAKNADQQSVWHVVYDRLYYRYGISLRAIVKKRKESTLDVAERLGHLEKIWAICSNELV